MSLERLPFPVEDLKVGMYVAALDRPWLETPFLFQGFLIENQDVIEDIREYCKYVYVDVERGDSSIILPKGAYPPRKPPASKDRRTSARTGSCLSPGNDFDDTAVLKAELVHARDAHTSAERAVRNLMDRLNSGDSVDLPAVQRTLDPMIDSILRNDDAMSWLTRMKKKNDYVYDHSISSSVWAMIFGKYLGLDKEDLKVLGTGAVFLDVGKTKIPNELLVKRGCLSPNETALMRRHVEFGVEIISKIQGIDARTVQMVMGHHERYNGTGYPKGLSGTEIPVFARIAGIVDAYDAMTTPRPYASPVSTYDAIRQLNNLSGVEFPEEVVEQFVQAIGVFPVGTLVELNTGQVGIVIAQNRIRRLRPKIMMLLDADKSPLSHFKIVDLRNQLADDSGHNSLWIEQGLAPGDYGLDPSEYYL